MLGGARIRVRIHGPFSATWTNGAELPLHGAKNRALLVLLATAPEGRRSRAFLQDMLWARAGPAHGRSSLRSALVILRRALGDAADAILGSTNDEVTIDLQAVELIGGPQDGEFLEGIDVAEDRFEDWLRERRDAAAPAAPPAPAAFDLRAAELRPSIAVLPFFTLESGKVEGIFGDLLSQEVTRALSRSRLLDVISHLSSRGFGRPAAGLAEVSGALGCGYVASGTVRLENAGFMLDLDFVDARSGRILWTRGFRGDVQAVFSGRSSLPVEIAVEIARSMVEEAVQLAGSRPLPSVRSHALLMASIALMHRQTPSSYMRSRTYLEEAIRRAPGRSELHAWLAKWHVLNVSQGWSADPAADARAAENETLHALDLNPECSFSMTIHAYVNNNLLKRFDSSMHQFEHALQIDPNNALALSLKSVLHAFMDQGAVAVALSEQARALSPLDPYGYFFDTLGATACLSAQDYEGALRLAERARAANGRHISALRARTIALQALGREAEAAGAARELMQRQPGIDVRGYLDRHPAADFRTGREWAAMLLAAGVPEHAS